MIQRKSSGFSLYAAHAICGVLMGFTAFLLTFMEEEIQVYRIAGL